MFARRHLWGCMAVFALLQASLMAQPAPVFEYPGLRYQPIIMGPPASGEFYHHDSTAAGNYMRGKAALIYAESVYRVNCAQAAILFEYQQSLELYNRELTSVYNDVNRRRFDANRQAGLSQSRLRNPTVRPIVRETNAPAQQMPSARVAGVARVESAATSLSETQFDRKTGNIVWPLVLQGVDYDTDRSTLEFLFRKLVSGTGRAARNSALVAECADRMRCNLASERERIDREGYLAGAAFLNALKHESATFILPTSTLASDQQHSAN